MSTNFGDILDRQTDDIERPKALPMGGYIWTIKGMYETGESAQKKTPYVEFTCVPIQATEDVDQDELKATLSRKNGQDKLLGDMTQRLTFYLTEDALWRLKEFLGHCGIDTEGRTLSSALEDTPGCQFLGNIRHEPSRDGSTIFAKIGTTAKAE